MFRYQVEGGHIAIKRRKKDWEGGFVKRRLKFVFVTGEWSLLYISPDLLTLISLIWFICFCHVKVCRIEKKYTEKMVTGKPELEIKAAPTEFHMKKSPLGIL